MKVVHVNTSDIKGGAAIAAHRLHKSLLRRKNIDSKMLVMNKESDEKEIFVARDSDFEKHIFSKIRRLLNKSFLFKYKDRKNIFFSPAKFGLDITKNKIIKEADIIHLHWIVGGYLSSDSLSKLFALNKKIVWTLHDSWAFTGGCHVRYSCNKYKNGCGNCPILNSNKNNDLSRKEFVRKEDIYSNSNVDIITPSKWLNTCVNESPLLRKFNNYVIPNTLDDSVFKSINNKIAKKILNLDAEKKYICFGALNSVSTEYKGWKYLKKALKYLNEIDKTLKYKTELLVFGASHSKDIKSLPFNVKFLGNFNDEISLSLVYNSADLFIAPSIEDNLPNTVLESLHCQTPVVAFDIGGMPDMIKHKKNGYLAKFKDTKDMAEGIIWTMQNLKNVALDNIKFNENNIVGEIISIYKNLE